VSRQAVVRRQLAAQLCRVNGAGPWIVNRTGRLSDYHFNIQEDATMSTYSGFTAVKKVAQLTLMALLVAGAGVGLGSGIAQAQLFHPMFHPRPHPVIVRHDPDRFIDRHFPNSPFDKFLDRLFHD
jgi:hypothetical protein